MLKHIAVRLKRFGDAETAFGYNENHKNKRKLVDSKLETRDPALKNLTEGLYEYGMEYNVDGCSLYWFLIEDENSIEYYQGFNEVECVFDSTWYEDEKNRIRHYSGMKYVDECLNLAKKFDIKDQERKIDYIL